MKTMQKGQIFSIDFIIAITVAVAVIAMLLHYYELGVYQNTETSLENELELIALNASNIMLETSKCNLAPDFKDQGYEVNGCSDPSKFDEKTKAMLMVPQGYECYIASGTTTLTPVENDCSATEPDEEIRNVAAIERNFMASTGTITKQQWESCISGTSCPMQNRVLKVMVWKE